MLRSIYYLVFGTWKTAVEVEINRGAIFNVNFR